MSGAAVAASMIGKNDLGYMTQTEVADNVRRITQAIDIPLVADADDGFGNSLNVQRTVRLYEQAGAVALHIEDMRMPKRCKDRGAGGLVPREVMERKIAAAVDARRDPDFLIIARTDTYEGIDEAIARGNAYAKAGVDMTFVVGLSSVEEMRRVCKEIPVPQLIYQHAGIATPTLPVSELEEIGYKLVQYPIQAFECAYTAARDWLKALRATAMDDKTREPAKSFPFSVLFEFEDILGITNDRRLQDSYLPKEL
jgi:2-methylisocitrate lyase-like PEP mutase family enzyme